MRETDYIDLSIVVPVYGSEEILPELACQIKEVMHQNNWSYELIFVCDLSPDNSWKVISKLAEEYVEVKGILLRINAGQHNALMAGFGSASGRVVVTMDDDLQHSPSDIPSLLAAIEQGADVAYARFISRRHPTWKIWGSKLNDVVSGFLMNKPKGLYLSPFRAFRSDIKEELLRYRGPYVYVDGLILGVTRNIKSVDVEHHARYAGESRYGMKKSISLWLKMATSFSILPLRLTSLMGLLCSGLGFLLALVFIVQKFTLDAMPDGWSSLIVTILMVGGVQLLALGMVGEYLGRALLTLNSKPQFVVNQRTGFPDESEGD